MNRSPYHLAPHYKQQQRPRQPVPGLKRLSTDSDDESSQGSRSSQVSETMPQSPPPSTRIHNPLMQQTHGTYLSRYGASRTMGTPVAEQKISSVPEESSSAFFHPLQFNHVKRKDLTIPMHDSEANNEEIFEESPLKLIADAVNEQIIDRFRGKDGKLPFARHQKSLLKLILPVMLVVVANKLHLLPTRIGFQRNWRPLDERKLEGRGCVMNLFVDKHLANEFNPDYDPTIPNGEPDADAVAVDGTYRTKGQVDVINRFISSVAAAFRPEVNLQQHIVFAGTRDGGHLAEAALQYWPARGSYHTQLHILADGNPSDELEYETLEDIEDRFVGEDPDVIHIYDSVGNKAGHELENDDDALDEALRGHNKVKQDHGKHFTELPDMRKFLIENDEYEESIIPYMHVDGSSMEDQMNILGKVTPMLEEEKVVVVGLEHSPDLDVHELIQFFDQLEYKTFMLGLRQLTRIDNLCPEILDNVMDHPFLAAKSDWMTTIGGEETFIPQMPPFFVAMPKGRHSKEEMSIQHMYDLFSGASGLLQVKTANDRVAAVK